MCVQCLCLFVCVSVPCMSLACGACSGVEMALATFAQLGQHVLNGCNRQMYPMKYRPTGTIAHLEQYMVRSCNRQEMYCVKYGPTATAVGSTKVVLGLLCSKFLVYCNYPPYDVQVVNYCQLAIVVIGLYSTAYFVAK